MALRQPRPPTRSAQLRDAAAVQARPEAKALRKAERKADAAFEDAERRRRDDEVDAAVAWQLERLATEDAFDGAPAKPKDPYAVHVGFRLDEGYDGARYLVLHASKATPARDELRFEFQKRLD